MASRFLRFVALIVSFVSAHALAVEAQVASSPKMPEDPIAAKAFAVLDQNCASCHQTGRLAAGARPGGGIGNILDLETVLRDRRLVTPGLPEASPLFTSMLRRSMPPQSNAEGNNDLAFDEIDAVRAWLLRGPAERMDCRRLSHDGARAHGERIAAFVRSLQPERARTTRFFSIGRASPDCVAVAEIERQRAGLAFAINSLSWALAPVPLEPVTEDWAVVAVDLALLGWTVDQWETLVSASPYLQFSDDEEILRRSTGSKAPIIRADWFVASALKAPFYYEALGLPDTLEGLFAALKVTANSDVVRRIGTFSSTVSRGRRLIERYPFANGTMWVVADFLSPPGRPDPLAQGNGFGREPLLERLASGEGRNDAALVGFDLPNGFRAFFAANGAGQRVDDVATSIISDPANPHSRIVAAQSCFACHGGGGGRLSSASSDDLAVRHRQDSGANGRAEREASLKLHFSVDELSAAVRDDTARAGAAMTAAGVPPEIWPSPIAPVVARYEEPLIAQDVELELGLSLAELTRMIPRLSAISQETVVTLGFGTVGRRAIEGLAAEVGALRRGENIAGLAFGNAGQSVNHPERIELRIVADRAKAASGENLVLKVRSDKACYLTLIGVDPGSRAMVLFPNDFDPKNALEPGVELTVPSPSAPYKFRMKTKGIEKVVGICSTIARPVDAIRHDYEKQRFTLLGDYRAFLQRAWDGGDEEDAEPRSGRGKARSGDKRQGRVPRGDIQGRTAIEIHVE